MNKAFYNAVIDVDLYYTIYEYITSNYDKVVENFGIKTGWDLDNASLETWKDLAEDAIMWLEFEQLPKVYHLTPEDNSPGKDTWGTLYYQTLAYMDKNHVGLATFRHRDKSEQYLVCRDCIEDLKRLASEIRELSENDLNN